MQIDVLPPFWARLQLRYLLRVWEFHERKNVEHSQWEWLSPLPHMFCCNLPRVPKRPRRSVEEEELNEILMKLTLDFTFTLRKVVSKNVMKLTAVLAGTFLVLFLRTQSANWGAPAILSRIAPPRSDLSLRVSCKNKLTKLRKCASRVREDTPPPPLNNVKNKLHYWRMMASLLGLKPQVDFFWFHSTNPRDQLSGLWISVKIV